MENLPQLLLRTIENIVGSQNLSSWTIHEGKRTVITLRFENGAIVQNPEGSPVTNQNTISYGKRSKSRLNRDKQRCLDHKKYNLRKNDLSTELARYQDSSFESPSKLSPEAMEFTPREPDHLLQHFSPPPHVDSVCAESVTEPLPSYSALNTHGVDTPLSYHDINYSQDTEDADLNVEHSDVTELCKNAINKFKKLFQYRSQTSIATDVSHVSTETDHDSDSSCSIVTDLDNIPPGSTFAKGHFWKPKSHREKTDKRNPSYEDKSYIDSLPLGIDFTLSTPVLCPQCNRSFQYGHFWYYDEKNDDEHYFCSNECMEEHKMERIETRILKLRTS